ncbi:MAG: putative transposase YbfD/YdcC [Myxococcota bacterium]|jgi:predicted transposase YbfD/YdcC
MGKGPPGGFAVPRSPIASGSSCASSDAPPGIRLVLRQVVVREKENETVAIPRLLKLVDLTGATVTMDAMGCQTAIAGAIIDEGGNDILQVKDNHPRLREHIEGFFADADRDKRPLDDPAPIMDESVDTDSRHGRIEERRCHLSHDLSWVDRTSEWPGLKAIARLQRRRENKASGETSEETAYYIISNAEATAAEVNTMVRSHWAIENSLHWSLDLTFDEVRCRIRKGNAAENFGLIRRASINLLRNAPNPGTKRAKVSIARQRRYCLMSTD